MSCLTVTTFSGNFWENHAWTFGPTYSIWFSATPKQTHNHKPINLWFLNYELLANHLPTRFIFIYPWQSWRVISISLMSCPQYNHSMYFDLTQKGEKNEASLHMCCSPGFLKFFKVFLWFLFRSFSVQSFYLTISEECLVWFLKAPHTDLWISHEKRCNKLNGWTSVVSLKEPILNNIIWPLAAR